MSLVENAMFLVTGEPGDGAHVEASEHARLVAIGVIRT